MPLWLTAVAVYVAIVLPTALVMLGALKAGRAHDRTSATFASSVRGVRELAELAGDEVGGLLADVDRVVADPLEAA
jgi:hypothetical protein